MPWNPWPTSDHRGLSRYVVKTPHVALKKNRTNLQSQGDHLEIIRAVYGALRKVGIRYALEPLNDQLATQIIRTPTEVLEKPREGTCLDLALVFAGACEYYELVPVVIVLDSHALVAVATEADARERILQGRASFDRGLLEDKDALIELLDQYGFVAVECTGFAAAKESLEGRLEGEGRGKQRLMTFNQAVKIGRKQLEERGFRFAIDICALRSGYKSQDPNETLALQILERFSGQKKVRNRRLTDKDSTDPLRHDFNELPDEAKNLAAIFALVGTGIELEWAASVLGISALEMRQTYADLQAARIVTKAGSFVNEQMPDLVLEETPERFKVFLHRKYVERMEASGAPPRDIALHWDVLGEYSRAAEQWFKAAENAETKSLFVEAADLFQKASESFSKADDDIHAGQMLKRQVDAMGQYAQGPEYERLLDQMAQMTDTPWREAGYLQAKAQYYYRQGNFTKAEEAARRGCRLADLSGDARQHSTLLNMLGVTLWAQKHFLEAEQMYQKALEASERAGDIDIKGTILMNLGATLSGQSRYAEAETYYRQALEAYRQINDKVRQADVLVNTGAMLRETGQARLALIDLEMALKTYRSTKGSDDNERRVLTQIAEAHRDLAAFSKALDAIAEATKLTGKLGVSLSRVREVRGHIWMFLGELELSEADLNEALATAENSDAKGRILLKQTRLWSWLGRDPMERFNLAKKHLEHTEDKLLLFQIDLYEGISRPSDEGLVLLSRALEAAQKYNLHGLEIIARTRLGLKLLSLDQPELALEQTSAATKLLERFSPNGSYAVEAMLAHYFSLIPVDSDQAKNWLESTKAWIINVSEIHVDPSKKLSFLRNNLINQSIMTSKKLDILWI